MRKLRHKGICDMFKVKLLVSGRVITHCDSVHRATIPRATLPVLTVSPQEGFDLRESWVQIPPFPLSVLLVKSFYLFDLFPHL